MTQLMPSPEERDWVIDELAELGRRTGWEPLVCAPSLLPEPRFFPDPWTPDADGVRRLARRLQRYAGLDELGVDVQLFEHLRGPTLGIASTSVHHEGAAAYFAGIVDEVCLFGVDVEQLGDGLGVTATMAHEVAHAFRTRFGLALTAPERVDEEERLTDLTTIYLGAGVLTTNAAARHRSEQAADGLWAGGHQWSFRSLGYLSPATMSFALAVVAVARGLGRGERRRLSAALEPNQAASFKRAVAWLERECADLRQRLGLPSDPASWPEPWSLDELTAPIDDPLPAPDEDDDDDDDDERDEEPWNIGRPVFRVLPGYQKGDNFLAGLLTFVAGAIVSSIVFWLGLLVGIGGFFGGRELVRKLGAHRCSDRECAERLPRGLTTCPNCGGTIMGEIRGAGERLAAEERLDVDE